MEETTWEMVKVKEKGDDRDDAAIDDLNGVSEAFQEFLED